MTLTRIDHSQHDILPHLPLYDKFEDLTNAFSNNMRNSVILVHAPTAAGKTLLASVLKGNCQSLFDHSAATCHLRSGVYGWKVDEGTDERTDSSSRAQLP